MEYKQFDFKVKEFGEQPGTFVGLASVYGNKDLQNEIVDVGAFSEANNSAILWSHLMSEVIGSTSAVTDDKQGLLIGGELDLDVQRGREAYSLLKKGHVRGLSVGFVTLKDAYEGSVRHIQKAVLKEVSITAFPANPQALVRSVKEELDPELKAGRILSTASVAKIRAAIDTLTSLIGEAQVSQDEASEPMGELETKPYPNEHACRLRDPGDFQEDSMRRVPRNHDGKRYNIIMGRLTGESTMTEQAYRYDKDTWTADAARVHCADHDGQFEAAEKAEVDKDEAQESDEHEVKEYQEFFENLKTVRVEIDALLSN